MKTGPVKRTYMHMSAALLLSVAALASCWSDAPGRSSMPGVYRTPDEVRSFLEDIHDRHQDITSIETVGTSVQGEDITALVISDNPDDPREEEPRVRLTGAIHGNEYISCEVLLDLAETLTEGYGSVAGITDLVDSRYIVLIPVLNPDGRWAGTRYNAHGVDLNRNFSAEWSSYETRPGDYPFSEPESAALRDYSLGKIFHLSATFHSGAVVVNLPFDYIAGSSSGVPVPENRPDEDELVWTLGIIYSTSGSTPFMTNPDILGDSDVEDGVVNGGDWYVINGSLQDWSYLESGCLDITIEVADYSPVTQEGVDEVVTYNREALLAYIDAAGMGVSGYVKDGGGNPLAGVAVSLTGGDIITKTDASGWFHRILDSGDYSLEFSLDGYTSESASFTVPDISTVDVELTLE